MQLKYFSDSNYDQQTVIKLFSYCKIHYFTEVINEKMMYISSPGGSESTKKRTLLTSF